MDKKKKPEAQERAVKAQFARTRHGAGTFPIEKDDVPKGKHAKRD